MSSRSSPLLAAPRSPCPEGPSEPFSDGAEVQVANLDYRMSRKDLQQTLHDTFSRYGKVSLNGYLIIISTGSLLIFPGAINNFVSKLDRPLTCFPGEGCGAEPSH